MKRSTDKAAVSRMVAMQQEFRSLLLISLFCLASLGVQVGLLFHLPAGERIYFLPVTS